MKVIIDYASSWRNSFLDGNNNEKLPSKGRKFIASYTKLKNIENFKKMEVTLNTVMGVLNRIIGDQRKLYKSKEDNNYFFKGIVKNDKVSFKDKSIETNEMTYIRNITGSTDRESFTGSIKENDVIFSSDYSDEFWGVLWLDFESLCKFIINDEPVLSSIKGNPITIRNKLKLIDKEKSVINEGVVQKALQVLNENFPGIEYLKKDKIFPKSFYYSSLYLQLDRLSNRFDMSSAKNKAGGISGVSKRTFTTREFMNRFTTGKGKKIWGNPYMRTEKIKDIEVVIPLMTKASGRLEINLDISRDKAKEIKNMIENAGVSSFYLGKKGLAYVSNIRV